MESEKHYPLRYTDWLLIHFYHMIHSINLLLIILIVINTTIMSVTYNGFLSVKTSEKRSGKIETLDLRQYRKMKSRRNMVQENILSLL